MRRFKIMSEWQANIFQNQLPYVFISIADPNRIAEGGHFINTKPNCQDVLYQFFWDVDFEEGLQPKDTEGLFNILNANQIIDFYLRWKDNIEFFAIHCQAGISRSSGTAAALQFLESGEGSNTWIFEDGRWSPNYLVYDTILSEAKKRNLI